MSDESPRGPNREDIRRFFRLLAHGPHGLTELRIIPPRGKPWIGFFDEEDAFVEMCATWCGKANVYAGRNPRPRVFAKRFPQACNKLARGVPGAKADDIEILTALSLDLDPIREKDIPSTDLEHQLALDVAGRIVADYPGAVLVDSGNGAQIFLPIAPLSLGDNARRVEAQTKAWEADVRKMVEEDPDLKLDSVYDLARIIRVAGTENIKGAATAERPHRLAHIVGEVPTDPCDMSEVFTREVNVPEEEIRAEGKIPERFHALLETDEKVRLTWNGERPDLSDSTRSGYDMAMVSLLHNQGFAPEEIIPIVLSMPSGTRDERRLLLTLKKARATVALAAAIEGKGMKVLVADAADDFLRDRQLEGKLRRWRGEWWIWNERCYDRLSEEECLALVVAYLRDHRIYRGRATQTFARNVLMNLASLGSLPDAIDLPFWIGDSGFERAPHLVILQNGIVDIERFAQGDLDVLQPHTAAYFCPTLLPFEFDPHAACPLWHAFLAEVLPSPDSQRFLQEWFGYNLVYDLSQQRFVIFEGEGANGKSVICYVLRHLIGNQNVSAVPLEVFGMRFQLGPTLGKLANIVPEMGELDRVAEGHLKPFVSGDSMQFDRKNKEPITAVPTARLTFATNTRPRFNDRSEGVWRRLVLVPFTVSIPPERQDRELGDKLIGELPGIFNWAVQGLQRLRERGHFVEPESSLKAKEDYRRETNPARVFLEEKCEVDPRHSVAKETLYQKYHCWAETNGYRPLGLAQFAKEVHRYDPSIRCTRPRLDGKRTQIFEGIEVTYE
ncbi:MAG: phage/plasmid primase, P4 family [Candidatus Eisenbacteria bacterium]